MTTRRQWQALRDAGRARPGRRRRGRVGGGVGDAQGMGPAGLARDDHGTARRGGARCHDDGPRSSGRCDGDDRVLGERRRDVGGGVGDIQGPGPAGSDQDDRGTTRRSGALLRASRWWSPLVGTARQQGRHHGRAWEQCGDVRRDRSGRLCSMVQSGGGEPLTPARGGSYSVEVLPSTQCRIFVHRQLVCTLMNVRKKAN